MAGLALRAFATAPKMEPVGEWGGDDGARRWCSFDSEPLELLLFNLDLLFCWDRLGVPGIDELRVPGLPEDLCLGWCWSLSRMDFDTKLDNELSAVLLPIDSFKTDDELVCLLL